MQKRDIPLVPEAIEALNRIKPDNAKGLVFTTSTGNHISPRNYQRSFDKILEDSGLGKICRIHDLRHTFGTTLLEHSVDLKTCSLLLGHSDSRFTAQTYIHPTESMKKNAVKIFGNVISSAK